MANHPSEFLSKLMQQLSECHYRTWHRRDPVAGKVSDVMFANPNSVVLLHTFPHVLSLFCSNDEMPCLEVFGFSSTYDTTFSVASAFLDTDSVENYLWVLKNLKELFLHNNLQPVILTHREPILIRAVEMGLPESQHLLWRAQFYTEIEEKSRQMVRNNHIIPEFLRGWQSVLEAENEVMYESQLRSIEMDFESLSAVLLYAKENWLIPYKERIVSAWTDRVTHFGVHLMANRMETVNSVLLRFPGSLAANFDTIWLQLHSNLGMQPTDISREFEECQVRISDFVASKGLYRYLRGHVSHKVLLLLESESERTVDSECGCYLRRTHGLPCAHELKEYTSPNKEEESIPVSEVHQFWKQLFTSALVGFPYYRDIEPFMAPYIQSWVEVEASNCGYRSVAEVIGMGERQWLRVRQDCLTELAANRYIYQKVFRYTEVEAILQGHEYNASPWDHWPDIGYVLATLYQAVVVIISNPRSYTFLPLISPANSEPANLEIAYLSTQNRFVAIHLGADAPIPPLMTNWYIWKDTSAERMETEKLQARFKDYIDLRKQMGV